MAKPLHIFLASQSQRRKDILLKEGFSFEIISSTYDEKPMDKTPEQMVMDHALGKATGANLKDNHLKERTQNIILGSDTVVAFEGKSLGKPRDLEQAEKWLNKMCGQYNEVYTGVALLDQNKQILKVDYDVSKVYFKKWTATEIKKYLEKVDVLDKAGAYAIQSSPQIVEKYSGSLTNIIGLPIEKLRTLLSEINAL